MRHGLKLALTAALGAACAYLTLRLSALVAYELQGPYNGDSPLFWAVGRGILNGLVPYRDLFETKPPGIFLLSTFSFWLGGDARLGAVLQSLVFLLLPLAVAIGALRAHRELPLTSEILLSLIALAFGTMLALYSGERAGEFQVESFGALMTCGYCAVLAWDPRPLGRRRVLLAALFLAGATGLKEPFALTALACALVLAQHPKDVLRSFLVPALLAGILGVAALGALGYLEPYLTVYLPEMMGRHIHGGAPLWRRGLDLSLAFNDLRAQSLLLALTVCALFGGSVLLRARSQKNVAQRFSGLLFAAAGAYLASLAIGIGGSYWNHHYVFAVPFYAALFLVCVREMRRHWSAWEMRLATATAAVIMTAAAFQQPAVDYAARLQNSADHRAPTERSARYIDAVLDACGVDRYLFLGPNGSHPFGFTRHSPIGPLFVQYEFWLEPSRPEFRRAVLDAVDAAGFAVVDAVYLLDLTDDVQRELDAHFSDIPWPCAADIPADVRYRYLFRTGDDPLPLAETLR